MTARPNAVLRVAVLGNAGGGKSTLARALAARHALPLVEVDALLWRPGWVPAPPEVFTRDHAAAIAANRWILDGLGPLASLEPRLARASHVVLVDLPLWMHFWLAAERQRAWAEGRLAHPPAGGGDEPPELRALFEMIGTVDRDWMPRVRQAVDAWESTGTKVRRLQDLEAVEALAASGLPP